MHLANAPAILASCLECRGLQTLPRGSDVSFWLFLIVYLYICLHMCLFGLCLDVLVVYLVSLQIGYSIKYKVGSTHPMVPQHTMGLLVQ